MNKNKILIAEDSAVFQNLAKRILSLQNFEITVAKNGKEVISILEKKHFDLLLLDINMPIMDGFECIKIIRAHEVKAIASIPVVAITGNAYNYSKMEFKEMGIDEYIQKPIDFDVLIGVIKKLTD